MVDFDLKSKMPPNLQNVECCGTCEFGKHYEDESYECKEFPITDEEHKQYIDEFEEMEYVGYVYGYKKCGAYKMRIGAMECFKMKGEVGYCPNCKGLIIIYYVENREGGNIGNCPICSEDIDNPYLDELGCCWELTEEDSMLLECLEKLKQKLKKESKV